MASRAVLQLHPVSKNTFSGQSSSSCRSNAVPRVKASKAHLLHMSSPLTHAYEERGIINSSSY